LLAAQADVVVLPAAPSGELAREVLASGVPVLAPRAPALAELREAIYQPDDLTEGLGRLLADARFAGELAARARELCHRHSWARVAQRHLELWAALEAA
jgi:glycosyltransferase involved in cell wall biosynthesis